GDDSQNCREESRQDVSHESCRSILRSEAALAGWRLPATTSRHRRRTTRAVTAGTQAPRSCIASAESRTEEDSRRDKGAIARASARQVNSKCPTSIADVQ